MKPRCLRCRVAYLKMIKENVSNNNTYPLSHVHPLSIHLNSISLCIKFITSSRIQTSIIRYMSLKTIVHSKKINNKLHLSKVSKWRGGRHLFLLLGCGRKVTNFSGFEGERRRVSYALKRFAGSRRVNTTAEENRILSLISLLSSTLPKTICCNRSRLLLVPSSSSSNAVQYIMASL